ncbi:PHD and RING finger domain-containing protein 1 [Chanos chanos]|uniref:PHD and RING finger domain-containing protein 1 n=1 Tax=Chanos chanos TaxID=29144 RepID=A0A6J2WPD2_CHACN|nr:PHD and RING finger domain-containing protein 1 [Chanos chanos]
MDEEDSQDELIKRNASHGKGKRPASSILSDEEDNSEDGEEFEDGESDSEEEDEDNPDEEEDEEGEEEEDGSEHEEGEKGLEGAVGGVAADLADLSSDEDSEKCPICLNSFHEQAVATPESCEHYFCLDCIMEWSKNANSCPVDRIAFKNICLRKCYGGKVKKMIAVQKPVKAGQEEQVDIDLEQTSCEVCGGSDREDRLLLCDGCDAGYHMECLTPPLDSVPVEEWFCPECAANNRNTGVGSGADEALPTTSHSQPRPSRPTRAIARTQQSERVRASVNRHRITQARNAQIAPRYLMQNTWLDETINAVVAGLNTAVYVRDLTPRSRSRRRRRTVKKRKSKAKSSSSAGAKTAATGVKRRKRRVKRGKSRRKLVLKKESSSRSRIAKSLGIKKPKRGSSLPSVFRPTEHTLGSMRVDIGAASLSVYGDPFDLDPFEDGEEEMQAHTPSSLLDEKRRGLSRSALRSHQPVARPIPAGLARQGLSIPQVEEVAEAAPVPDLLGSILSGQSMLLMDSSDVVINRDGSLKATKPVSLPSPRNCLSTSSSSGETGSTSASGASVFQSSREAGLSSCTLIRQPSTQNSSTSCSPPAPLPSSHLPTHPPHLPQPTPAHPRLQSPLPPRPSPSNVLGHGHSHWSVNGVRGQAPTRVTNGTLESQYRGRDSTSPHPLPKKPPPKPVWVDVSVLPRIPKIKREPSAHTDARSGNTTNNLPGSSINSLAGDRSRQHTVDQQSAGASQQGQTMGSQRQRFDRPGPSSSFSSSSASPSGSLSNDQPSPSSSTVSFRINASGNSWHTRRLATPGVSRMSCNSTELSQDEILKKNHRSKQILLASRSKAKKPSENEVYDPFNPTGSDSNSSDSELESEAPNPTVQDASSGLPGHRGIDGDQVKSEPMDLESSEGEDTSGISGQIKKESDLQLTLDSSSSHLLQGSPVAVSDTEHCRGPESTLKKKDFSSPPSSHYCDKEIKTEVKSEPEDGSSENKNECSATMHLQEDQQQAFKITDPSDGYPSVPRNSEAVKRENEPEKVTQRSHTKERRSHSRSQSPSSKFPERTHKKMKSSQLKDKRRSRSRSKDRRSSRSRSRERRRSRSHSKERRRSRSRSKNRRHTRSRSKERRRSRSKDRRRHSRSSSREGSRRRRSRKESSERTHSRGRERHKSREKRLSQSRSRSRSRSSDRKRDRVSLHQSSSSSSSKDANESRSKKQRSRSPSRDKRKEGTSHGSHDRERNSRISINYSNKESKESNVGLNKNDPSLEMAIVKSEAIKSECEGILSISSIKEEPEPYDIGTPEPSISVELSKEPEAIKQESNSSLSALNTSCQIKEIKKETNWCMDVAKEPQQLEEIKKEKVPFGNVSKTSQEIDKIKYAEQTPTCSQDEKRKEDQNVQEPKKVQIETIWPDETDQLSYSDSPLVIDEDLSREACQSVEQVICFQEKNISNQMSTDSKKVMKIEPLPSTAIIKQETVEASDDEDINVDYLIDNLDFIKSEMKESTVTNTAGVVTVDSVSLKQEEPSGGKLEKESISISGTKSKSQGKRVTWNLQEPEGPQPVKSSKLALFKLKLKQEGSRKSVSTTQTANQDGGSAFAVTPTTPTSINHSDLEEKTDSDQGGSRAHRDKILQDPHQKDKYMKKLHMQERAIEEVKLAIKPFYQKRDITKEEYKEILRKAVQKVCHSKSGEINPVKVANLVKAYVDKYKHARKHRKGPEDNVQNQEADCPKDIETPG